MNEYIKKIIVYAPDKSSGKRKQKVKIFFNFVDDVDIPVTVSYTHLSLPTTLSFRRVTASVKIGKRSSVTIIISLISWNRRDLSLIHI